MHRQFRVRDDRRQNLLRFICDGVEFVEEAFTGMLPIMRVAEEQVRVFVHCRMGISRSGSVVVAYSLLSPPLQ